MKEIDARNQVCPAPVLMIRKALKEEKTDNVKIIVSSESVLENVSNFLESQNFSVSIERGKNEFQVTGRREKTDCKALSQPSAEESKNIMVVIASERIGKGDDELGAKLMLNFINTLGEMEDDLWRLVFVNGGVKLTIQGAETLAPLQKLETGGGRILVCGTCLDHFNLLDKKQAGVTANMLDIVMAMQFADKVITF